MDIGFDEDVDAADAVERPFFILVALPVAARRHVFPLGFIFLVAWNESLSGYNR